MPKTVVRSILSSALLIAVFTFFSSLIVPVLRYSRRATTVVEVIPHQTPGEDLPVTEEEVRSVLTQWGEGIVEIGRVSVEGGDYQAKAAEVIDNLYAYGTYPVMFKPTNAAWHPFRPTRAGAVSYFVGGNHEFPEDIGFAIHPWQEVRFDTANIELHNSNAVAMGTYEFVDMDGGVNRADFTFGFRHDDNEKLLIVLHHSSLPYNSEEEVSEQDISVAEVRTALADWGNSMIQIGNVYMQKGDYMAMAAEVINRLYGYEFYDVLFKPTKAAWMPFRPTIEGALSYFVGGDPNYPEDAGFAINPWKVVRMQPDRIVVDSSSALAMGTYVFEDFSGSLTTAEFTLGYRKDDEGHLRIVLHHSSLPAQPLVGKEVEQRDVTEQEVAEMLQAWGDGIISISRVHSSNGDYERTAKEMIETQYAFGEFPVLFKPTTTTEHGVRSNFDGVLSYFVGGNPEYPEDQGFAITPLQKVRFFDAELSAYDSTATAMGSYEFTDMQGETLTAEFTFQYRRDSAGNLRIVLHHSSLPFHGADKAGPEHRTANGNSITEEEVQTLLADWGARIVKIGKIKTNGGDYKQAAADMVDRVYGYNLGPVLFKPTKASYHPFRTTRDGAISYLVGGNSEYPEDNGFAITPWTDVNFDTTSISLHDDGDAMAMGTYTFIGVDGSATTAEFTFGFRHDDEGTLRIVLHHSSLPFGGDWADDLASSAKFV